MMRRLSAVMVTAIGLVLGCSLLTVVLVYQSQLEQSAESARTRTIRSAGFVVDEISQQLQAGKSTDQIDTWLGTVAEGVGFERLVVADSLGFVGWSGNPLVERGDDILPLVIDTSAYRRSLLSGEPVLSPLIEQSGVVFQSLYFPFSLDTMRYVLMIDTDRRYLRDSQSVRNGLVGITVAFAVMFAVLAMFVHLLLRRVAKAEAQSEEHRRLAFMGTVAAELAHELKNPLAIVKSSLDVLRRKFDPAANEQAFVFAGEEVMRVSRLIDEMLAFSKDRPLTVQDLNLAGLIGDMLEARRPLLGDIALSCTVEPGITVKADKDALVQILDNLIRNAAAILENKGTLSLGTTEENRHLCVTVTDSGPGVPENLRETLFEPFVSGHAAGTGLGLAITRSLCECLGWSIALQSSLPTTFVITIPEPLWHRS